MKKAIRYAAVCLLTMAMVAAAEYSGEQELLFPEILALAVGAWAVEQQPWRVSRLTLWGLMSLSALTGVLLVRYVPGPQLLRIGLGFLFAGLCLVLTRTSIAPMLSACILPVLLGTDSFVYPAAVVVLTGMIAGGQLLMGRAGLRPRENGPVHTCAAVDWRREALKWTRLLVAVVLLAAVSQAARAAYLIAPPLLVAFVEMANPKCGARRHPWRALMLLSLGAALGALCRLGLSVRLGWPLWVAAGLAAALLLFLFDALAMTFVPAGALALLPMLLPAHAVVWYPAQVLAGAAAFLLLAFILFPAKKIAIENPATKFEEDGDAETPIFRPDTP